MPCVVPSDYVLFVSSEVSRAVRRHMERSGSVTDNWFLIFAVIGILVLWASLMLWDKHRKRATGLGNDPFALFWELCQIHHLSRQERGMLLKAAEKAKKPQPAMVFVEPKILEKLSRSPSPDAKAYRTLQAKLFGDISGR